MGVSMPSGYLSNLNMSSADRQKIWDSMSADHQQSAAARLSTTSTSSSTSGTTGSTTTATNKFKSLGTDYQGEVKGKTDAVSVANAELKTDTLKAFSGLVNTASMTSAVFVTVQQGNDPSLDSGDEVLAQQVSASYKAAAAAFGGDKAQALLGYDANNNGYLDSESELFGFGSRGLDLNDYFSQTTVTDPNDPANSTTTYQINDTDTDPDSGKQIDQSRFMVLRSDGASVRTTGDSTTSGGAVPVSTHISLNLTSGSFTKGADIATVKIDINA